ncbi:hypothetical protein K9F62_10275 [Desulfovibrio sp. JY]|nr:hypothetical protein K9F62_10275 [Desulfovibrio sp. JY]
MVTLRDISAGVASININLDGTTYVWTVGALDGVADVQAYLEAHADDYRSDIRAALAMGRQLEIVTPPTLTEAIAAKLAAIRAACDAALNPLAASYPEREVQSWPQQVTEATALESDAAASAPLIRQMAAMRPSLGDTQDARVAELARRIRQNAADWSAVAGPIIGKRQALEDQVSMATTPAKVEAIVVDFTGGAA